MDIAKSIHQLAEIFRDLQTMIIDQGTILDRIDYNIEQVATSMKSAHTELEVVSYEALILLSDFDYDRRVALFF
jgi:syntaxin 16